MTEQELREKIAHIVFGEDSDQVAWGDFKSVSDHCFTDADHILALIKEAGYKSPEEVEALLSLASSGNSSGSGGHTTEYLQAPVQEARRLTEEENLIAKICQNLEKNEGRRGLTFDAWAIQIFALIKESLPELAKEAGYVKLIEKQRRILETCSGHHL